MYFESKAPESNLVYLSVSLKSIPCVSRMGVMYSRVREATFFTSLTYVLLWPFTTGKWHSPDIPNSSWSYSASRSLPSDLTRWIKHDERCNPRQYSHIQTEAMFPFLHISESDWQHQFGASGLKQFAQNDPWIWKSQHEETIFHATNSLGSCYKFKHHQIPLSFRCKL